MSDIRQRVIAKVTGREYIPTTVVAITEGQEVVNKMLGPAPSANPELDTLLAQLRPATPEEIQEQRQSALDHGAMRGERQARVVVSGGVVENAAPLVVGELEPKEGTQRMFIDVPEMVARFKRAQVSGPKEWTRLSPDQLELLEAFEFGVSVKLLRRLKNIEAARGTL